MADITTALCWSNYVAEHRNLPTGVVLRIAALIAKAMSEWYDYTKVGYDHTHEQYYYTNVGYNHTHKR